MSEKPVPLIKLECSLHSTADERRFVCVKDKTPGTGLGGFTSKKWGQCRLYWTDRHAHIKGAVLGQEITQLSAFTPADLSRLEADGITRIA